MELSNIAVPAPRSLAEPPHAQVHRSDLLVVGGGLAGLTAALTAAEHTEVTLLARVALHESNSSWAQGGIAAALDPRDTPRAHVADTLVAGAGLCDQAAVELLAGAAPGLMRELAALGVPFERDGGDFALGLEGGHSYRRILHVGDATGWAVTQVLIARALAHPRIHIHDTMQVVDLLGRGACEGALARDALGGWHRFLARATILATGGAGALFGISSNPPAALGEGIALAYRAGAEVADLEFFQFHPTVFRTPAGQGFLITEAARGEGGILRSPAGRRFMPAYDPRGELAPRDIVTRGIVAAMRDEGSDHALLDLTHLGAAFLERRFPTIVARLRAEGLDPAVRPIPIAPAAHYLMGGIRTDLSGATSLPGLYAAGECACTGVHGANRLASNSLLECLVFGRAAAQSALLENREPRAEDRESGVDRRPPTTGSQLSYPTSSVYRPSSIGSHSPADSSSVHRSSSPEPSSPGWRADLAAAMIDGAGPIRDEAGLRLALSRLGELALPGPGAGGEAYTAANAALAARLIAAAALLRRESRGGHFRSDVPAADDRWRAHIVHARGRAPAFAETISERGALTLH